MQKILSFLDTIFRTPLKWLLFLIFIPFLVFYLQQAYTNYSNQEQEKLDYSQSLIRLTEKRAYLAKNYYDNFRMEPDFDERKTQLWSDYAESVKEYNIELVPSLIIIQKNYGNEIQGFYHQEVYDRLRAIHIELAKLRTNDEFNKQQLEENFKEIDNRKYRFAETLINCEAKNIIESIQFFISKQIGSLLYNCKIY